MIMQCTDNSNILQDCKIDPWILHIYSNSRENDERDVLLDVGGKIKVRFGDNV